MWADQIVEETRKVREAYAAKFNYDLEAICRDLQEQARHSNRKLVSLPPKKPEPLPRAKAS